MDMDLPCSAQQVRSHFLQDRKASRYPASRLQETDAAVSPRAPLLRETIGNMPRLTPNRNPSPSKANRAPASRPPTTAIPKEKNNADPTRARARTDANARATVASVAAGSKIPPPAGKSKPHRIGLALQGGGSHGAFTWGVLDRLLEDDGIEIEGVSGTSAGAMNAAAMSHGFLQAGREGARLMLADFWKAVSRAGTTSPMQPSWLDRALTGWNMDFSPGYMIYDLLTRMIPPEQLNPTGLSPLRDILNHEFDFDAIRRFSPIKIFVTATNLTTGKAQIFRVQDLTADVLLASACLPSLFAPVEINGEYYWDGGYMGNPTIYPLIYECATIDVLLVQITPITRPRMPTTAREIIDRITEVSFNSTLMREMRTIASVTKMLDEGMLDRSKYRRMYMHVIRADEIMQQLSPSSKLNAEWEFLEFLHDVGYRSADSWLAENRGCLGTRSSVDILSVYM